jgi:hypothetical protein
VHGNGKVWQAINILPERQQGQRRDERDGDERASSAMLNF